MGLHVQKNRAVLASDAVSEQVPMFLYRRLPHGCFQKSTIRPLDGLPWYDPFVVCEKSVMAKMLPLSS